MNKRRIVLNRGFTLVELVVVMSIISIIIVIAVPLYKNYIGETVYRVWKFNLSQFERKYHVYLLMENKEHTNNVFDEFFQNNKEIICPDNGDIKYVNGKVRCMLHSEDKANGNNDDGSVPFL